MKISYFIDTLGRGGAETLLHTLCKNIKIVHLHISIFFKTPQITNVKKKEPFGFSNENGFAPFRRNYSLYFFRRKSNGLPMIKPLISSTIVDGSGIV